MIGLGMFKVVGFVLGGIAVLVVAGVAGFLVLKRQGALRGE